MRLLGTLTFAPRQKRQCSGPALTSTSKPALGATNEPALGGCRAAVREVHLRWRRRSRSTILRIASARAAVPFATTPQPASRTKARRSRRGDLGRPDRRPNETTERYGETFERDRPCAIGPGANKRPQATSWRHTPVLRSIAEIGPRGPIGPRGAIAPLTRTMQLAGRYESGRQDLNLRPPGPQPERSSASEPDSAG